MRKFFLVFVSIVLNFNSKIFADDVWFFEGCSLSQNDIKAWNKITIDTIPCMLSELVDVFMWIAWSVAIIFIIVGSYQMLFWSLAKDNAKWKSTIIFAITWFVLAAFSWLIVRFILDNFWA